MKNKLAARTLALLGAVAVSASLSAAAQAPGGPGGGGQGGGFARRMPFVMGSVTAVNASAGTMTVQSQFGGDPQTVQISGTTQVVTQETATVADLKVGDTIQVQGVPTSITASSVTIGQMPNMFPGGGGGGNRQGGGGPGGGGPGGAGGPGGPGQAANASASGKITALSPLTIALSSSATLTLKMASDAKVTRFKTSALSSVKVGDRIMAAGAAGSDGTFAATSVGINVQMGGMMGGGMMGGPGGGGFRGGGGGFRGGQGGGFPGGPPPGADPNGGPPPQD